MNLTGDRTPTPQHAFFTSEERRQAEEVAWALYRALETLGVVLDDIHIDDPCDRCRPHDDRVFVSLGNLPVEDVRFFAETVRGLTGATSHAQGEPGQCGH